MLEREDRVLEAIEYTEDGAGLTGLNLVMREMRVRETPFLLAVIFLRFGTAPVSTQALHQRHSFPCSHMPLPGHFLQ